MSRIGRLAATTFGTGLSPVAPGTAGSLVAAAALAWAGSVRPLPSCSIPLAAVLVPLFFIGKWASDVVEAEEVRAGRRKDPSMVNVDEAFGMGVSALFWPSGASVAWLIPAFLLFRLFDIVKPFPANRSQSLPGGWGIMADDLIAGVYANLALQVLMRVF
ncbi:MAG: phosphatidylglycerophosphatase A [bacterium]|nr:phosphatidylglycerophosphatase A [bacterium]